MADDEKRDENLHELDREPATGSVDSNDTEQRASTAWGGNNHADAETPTDETGQSVADERTDDIHHEKQAISPVHDDISPASIPMSTRPREVAKANHTVAQDDLPKPGPGLMVLQWLTYAFWGWTVFSLSGLVLVVVAGLLNQNASDWTGGIAYLLAAVIVLFIISLVTDAFYAHAEKKHVRTGGTSVIMIIHAVLFALFAIGSLIAAVFGLVSLLINDTSGSTGPLTTIVSGSIIAVIYGLTLLRTLRPRWIKAVVPMYWIAMSVAVILTVALAIAGPVAQARLQNEDRLVEEGAPDVARVINSYTDDHGKLPRSLSDLTSVSQEAQQLIDDHRITYQPGELVSPAQTKLNVGANPSTSSTQYPVYHYTLCVDYKAKDDTPDYASYEPSSTQKYRTSLSTYGHKAGHVCYELQTGYTYNY